MEVLQTGQRVLLILQLLHWSSWTAACCSGKDVVDKFADYLIGAENLKQWNYNVHKFMMDVDRRMENILSDLSSDLNVGGRPVQSGSVANRTVPGNSVQKAKGAENPFTVSATWKDGKVRETSRALRVKRSGTARTGALILGALAAVEFVVSKVVWLLITIPLFFLLKLSTLGTMLLIG